MLNIFKKKKKRKMLDLVKENDIYKVYNGEDLVFWGTDLMDILDYIEKNSK